MKTPPHVLIALMSAFFLTGCSQGAPAAKSDVAQTVEVLPLKSDVMATTVALPGQLLPYESVDVYPKVSGFIRDIKVDRGSKVGAGQLLVQLSAPELTAQRQQAAAALRAAQAKLAQDRSTYERLANAAKTPGVVADNDVDAARELAAADEAQVASAREAVRSVSEQEGYLSLRAPFGGVVTSRNLHPGALVGPASGSTGGGPILQIVKADRLRLAVAVPETYAQEVATGQMVSFTVSSAPGRTFQAPVSRFADALDPRTRSMMVELDVTNPGDEIRANEFATVKWPVRRRYPTLQAPTTAVANDQQRQFVIKVANGVANWVDVTTGLSAEGKVEVFGALKPGDLIVRRGTDALANGARVRPAAPAH